MPAAHRLDGTDKHMAQIKGSRSATTKIPERYKTEETEELSKHWQTYFLDRLATTSNVTDAAAYCGAGLSRVYKLRRVNPAFAQEWRKALLEGYEHLELETIRRLREGTPADGPKYDIASALRLLALHKDTVAKERARVDHSDEAAILDSLNARLDAIRRNEQGLAEMLSRETVSPLPDADS